MIRAIARALGSLAVVAVLGLMVALPASAEMTNGCTGSLAGQDVGARSSTDAKNAIPVQWDQVAAAQVTSPAPITGYHVELEFAGFRYTVAHGESSSNSWRQDVQVRQYAVYGVGLYKVIGTSTGAGACSASFLVNIVGKDPLSTPAGVAAAAVLAIGALGTAAATLASAAGTPPGARPYLNDLRLVESGLLPDAAIEPYMTNVGEVSAIFPEGAVPTGGYNEFPPDAITVQEVPYNTPPPDAISVPDPAYEVPPLDAISVPDPGYAAPPPDAISVPDPAYEVPPQDAISVPDPGYAAPPPDAINIPDPPPRRGI